MAVNEKELLEVARKALENSLKKSGVLGYGEKSAPKQTPAVQKIAESVAAKSKDVLKEALVVIPKTFAMKTEWLSAKTKEAHERLYKAYVAQFNQASVIPNPHALAGVTLTPKFPPELK